MSFWERERKSQKNLKDALKKLKNLTQGVSDTDKDLKEEVEKITDVLVLKHHLFLVPEKRGDRLMESLIKLKTDKCRISRA